MSTNQKSTQNFKRFPPPTQLLTKKNNMGNQRGIFDVGIYIIGNSKSYGKWNDEILPKDNKIQLYTLNFVHRFLVLF